MGRKHLGTGCPAGTLQRNELLQPAAGESTPMTGPDQVLEAAPARLHQIVAQHHLAPAAVPNRVLRRTPVPRRTREGRGHGG